MTPIRRRIYPSTVTMPDGRIFYNALVIAIGGDVNIYATKKHYPDGEYIGDPRVVLLVSFPASRIEDIEKNVSKIETDAGDVQVVKSGRCACSDFMKNWRP